MDHVTGSFGISLVPQQHRVVIKSMETESSISKTDTDSLWNDIEDVEESDDSMDETIVFLKVS